MATAPQFSKTSGARSLDGMTTSTAMTPIAGGGVRAVRPGQLSWLANPMRGSGSSGATPFGFPGGSAGGNTWVSGAGLSPAPTGGGYPGGLPGGSAGGNMTGGFNYDAFSSVAPNPYQTKAYDVMDEYLKGLAANQDKYATDTLARQRDINAASMADVRTGAGARGFGIDTGVSSTLQGKQARANAANLATMGSELGNAGRQMQLTGLGQQGSLGSNIAQSQTAQQNALTNFYQAQAQAQLAQWVAQNNAAQQAWQNYYTLYNNPSYRR